MENPLAMIAFRMYLLVRSLVESTIDVTTKAVGGAMEAFEPREYYFLHGYATPFKSTSVNIHATTAAPVEYHYNADLKQFNDLSQHSVTRYLPVLSLEVIRDGHAVYDLTDFIESMTVTSDVSDFRFPSVSQIISAWAIGSHIMFDKNIDFKVYCMSDAGESYEFDVSDTVDIYKAIAEADAAVDVAAAAAAVERVVAAEARALEAEAKATEAEERAAELQAKADELDADTETANVVANAVTQVVAQAVADAISQEVPEASEVLDTSEVFPASSQI